MRKTYFLLILIAFLPNADAGAQIASSEYVDQRMESVVSVDGEQEITGKKIYTESPMVPTPALPVSNQTTSDQSS